MLKQLRESLARQCQVRLGGPTVTQSEVLGSLRYVADAHLAEIDDQQIQKLQMQQFSISTSTESIAQFSVFSATNFKPFACLKHDRPRPSSQPLSLRNRAAERLQDFASEFCVICHIVSPFPDRSLNSRADT
jgi:hypothetical protein